MSIEKFPVSYSFGAYNEEDIILSTIKRINEKLIKVCGVNNYEILIIENGSTDKTFEIINNLQIKNVRIISISQKSHGKALKIAIEKAKYNHIIITGADLPFNFSDLDNALPIWNKYDIIFGSKAHPQSVFPTPINRRIASKIYSFLLHHFFGLSIRDPQGSIFLNKQKILPLLKYCNASNAFFTSQLAIYAQKKHLAMKEIPVIKSNTKIKRRSKYKIRKDGIDMFMSIINEYRKIKKI